MKGEKCNGFDSSRFNDKGNSFFYSAFSILCELIVELQECRRLLSRRPDESVLDLADAIFSSKLMIDLASLLARYSWAP